MQYPPTHYPAKQLLQIMDPAAWSVRWAMKGFVAKGEHEQDKVMEREGAACSIGVQGEQLEQVNTFSYL